MTKSSSYRLTFRRHRKLFSIPPVIAVVIAAFFVMTSPKSYESTASLWVDNPAPLGSSLGDLNPAVTPPAQQEQGVLTELLSTQAFVLDVAHHSLLAQYLASSHPQGFSLSSLTGGGGGSLNQKIVAAMGAGQVTTAVPGPQVLQINYVGPTPQVAQSTLNAIMRELKADSVQFSDVHNRDALGYYKAQAQAATEALVTARAQASQYRAQHPDAAANDPNLAALSTAESAAASQLTAANASLNAAASSTKGANDGSALQVIDAASLPTSPSSGKKKKVEGILGGLIAGVLISFLGVVALTRKKTDRWEDELAESANGQSPYPPMVGTMMPPMTNGHRHPGAPVSERASEPPASAPSFDPLDAAFVFESEPPQPVAVATEPPSAEPPSAEPAAEDAPAEDRPGRSGWRRRLAR